MRRKDIRKLKKSQGEYRDKIREQLVFPLNQILLSTHKKAAEEIINCLQNEKYSEEEAYSCKKEVDRQFELKMDRYKFFANKFDEKMDKCLGGCKNDFTIGIVECYQDCFGQFKRYLDKIKFD